MKVARITVITELLWGKYTPRNLQGFATEELFVIPGLEF